MGKIDKEKLLEEFSCVGSMCLYDVRKVIKNFPEEQEIDFDALWKEYEEKYSCKKTVSCDNCTYPNKLYYTTICFVDFLKSKNLTQPQVDMDALRNEIYASIQKPSEIPVKKTWTLKKEYQEAFKDFDFSFNRVLSFESEPAARRIKYYDLHKEPDYSKIPEGSIVEIECLGDKFYRTFVKFEHENIFTKDGEDLEPWLESHVNLRIVELAKE